MGPHSTPTKICPACQSHDYLFRGRKKVPLKQEQEVLETKYRCKACGQEWKVRTIIERPLLATPGLVPLANH